MPTKAERLRAKILELTGEFYSEAFPTQEFIPGSSSVQVAGKVFDATELKYLVDASLDFWLTTGRYAAQFEKEFSRWWGVRHTVLVNSGSSANLLALSVLTSPQLGTRALKPGDEVITVASGFPTTLNPIIQNQLVPVFVDVHIPTYNVDISQLEGAYSKKTRAIILAHTLGNPFNLDMVAEFAKQHDLWLIEDCCDAAGARYKGRAVGTFGQMATVSFYPAHHITMGEGGAVLTDDSKLKTLIDSFRDWGRDCWCGTGQDDTCGKRFDWQLGDLPHGYDHKYTYSNIGYNLKATEMQAAVGLAQLKKLDGFIQTRRANFNYLFDGLKDLQEYFILPESTPNSEPSWFGFPIAVSPGAPFTRNQIVRALRDKKIATRLLFGGNLVRQPAYRNISYRIAGTLENSDFVMNNVFWVGVYPGLDAEKFDYMLDVLHELVTGHILSLKKACV